MEARKQGKLSAFGVSALYPRIWDFVIFLNKSEKLCGGLQFLGLTIFFLFSSKVISS